MAIAPTDNNKTFDNLGALEQILASAINNLAQKIDFNSPDNNWLLEIFAGLFGYEDKNRFLLDRPHDTDLSKQNYNDFDFKRAHQLVTHTAPSIDAPPPVPSTPIPEGQVFNKFLDHLTEREGSSTKIYMDPVSGKPHIGVGHLITPSDPEYHMQVGDTVSPERVHELLEQDAGKAFEAAQTQATELGVSDQNFIIALGSVNFQLGTSWKEDFKETWALMKQGDFNTAAYEAADSLWAEQTPVRTKDFQTALVNLNSDFQLAASNEPPAIDTPAISNTHGLG